MFEHISWTCEPCLSGIWLALWLILAFFFVVWEWHHFEKTVRWSYRLLLQGLRCGVLLLIFLLFVQPVIIQQKPEKGAFRVSVLLDQSRSMDRVDRGALFSRRQQLQKLLTSPSIQSISEYGTMEFQGFSNQIHPVLYPDAQAQLPVLPGTSNLGDVMRKAAKGQPGAKPIGAMLLLSDGRSNAGVLPTEVAKQFAKLNIPVSCVGIGNEGVRADVQIHFKNKRAVTASKNQPYTVSAVVRNDFDYKQQLTIKFSENGQEVQTQQLAVAGHAEETVHFVHSSLIAGMRSLSVGIESPAEAQKLDNDIDYMPVQIHEPDQFRILYLSSVMDWEWRFLKMNMEENKQIVLSAIIKTGKENFFNFGLGKETLQKLSGFPEETEIYANIDGVIADFGVLLQMSDKARKVLISFVNNKGGGLLIMGLPPEQKKTKEGAFLPDDLQDLCPVLSLKCQTGIRSQSLIMTDSLIFNRDGGKILHTSRGLPLYAGVPIAEIEKAKKAARTILQLKDGAPVMAAQSYGAGRCVYLGFNQTWRWRMLEENGEELHEHFWNLLLTWLGSNQKSQLEVVEQPNYKMVMDELVRLQIRVSGIDFLPAPNADASVVITAPDQKTTRMKLEPSLEEMGSYTASFVPLLSGVYHFDYHVLLPEGKELHASSSALSILGGVEVQNTDYNEELLRDIARISGGKYISADDFLKKEVELPLSTAVPLIEKRQLLLSHWWMLILVLGAMTAHWWLRRRIGLK
ncbi:MAG: vWA domain-containing protein [Lentisphaeria bacterium]